MPSVTVFYDGPTLQQSSEPFLPLDVQEGDCWPVDNRSESGAKDQLDDGLHPVVAIGGIAEAGRGYAIVGVVTTVNMSVLGTATDRVELNVAPGAIVRQYVSNILTYSGEAPNTYEQTPVVGQPVYVDDSADLSAGVTLSMSPLNHAGLANPLAGWLVYCQDEIADGQVGGGRLVATFDTALANEAVEQVYCVMLRGAGA
jgi:hypothetical protein